MLIRRQTLGAGVYTAIKPPQHCRMASIGAVDTDVRLYSFDDPTGSNGNYLTIPVGFERSISTADDAHTFRTDAVAFVLWSSAGSAVTLIWG